MLSALGLENWRPPEPLTYTRRASEAVAAGRLDAEHFQPKYRAMLDHIRRKAKRVRVVNEFAAYCDRGEQPEYIEGGTLSVINSQHILENGLNYENFEKTDARFWKAGDFVNARVQEGDILTYMTGANVGRTAVYLGDERALAANEVGILRLNEEDPVYVAAIMNSIIGRWQTRMSVTGSAQVHLYPADIRRFVIPFIGKEGEDQVAGAIRSAHAARRSAHEMLERAKRAVEIAIEQDEPAALAFLDSK